MTSRFIPSHLLTYISRSPPAQVAVLHKGIPVQETSPSLPLFAASFRIPITCTARTVRLLPLRQLRTNDYFVYNGSSLRSSACIDLVRLHRLRSLTMSDTGKSGDAITLPSTGYFLKLVFMFISFIIMNIFILIVV
jgi:hypothetical protein